MPTLILYRKWCKTCKDYTLHHRNDFTDKNYVCKECKAVFAETELSAIPEEKQIEQRKRYISACNESMGKFGSTILGGDGGGTFFAPVGSDREIKEDDAGQIAIDHQIRLIQEEARKKRREERILREQEAARFVNLGRNDPCACGSGKKYKNCHLREFKDVHRF